MRQEVEGTAIKVAHTVLKGKAATPPTYLIKKIMVLEIKSPLVLEDKATQDFYKTQAKSNESSSMSPALQDMQSMDFASNATTSGGFAEKDILHQTAQITGINVRNLLVDNK
jgi:hypothetical protein